MYFRAVMSFLWIFLFASLAIGAKAQELDLSDALGIDDDVPTKTPIPKVPDEPKKSGGGELDLFDALGPDTKDPAKPPKDPKAPAGDGFDLFDALGPDTKDPAKPPKDPKAPAGDGFDLYDALGPDTEPKKPAVNPPKDGGTGGGSFGDTDLLDVLGGDSEYKPDKGKGGGGGGGYVHDPSSDHDGSKGSDKEPAEAGSSSMTGILSAVGVAIVGAVGSYIAYQKKRLCFRIGGGNMTDANRGGYGPRSGPAGNRAGNRNQNRSGGGALSNLLRLV